MLSCAPGEKSAIYNFHVFVYDKHHQQLLCRGREAEYCDEFVCLHVCLSARIVVISPLACHFCCFQCVKHRRAVN